MPKNLKVLTFCWLIGFFLVNAVCHLSAGTNADSRLATLLAMAREQSFRIDSYQSMTADWARTPDGHYFSNKAPGPIFLAAVPFWIWDNLFPVTLSNKSHSLKFLSYTLQLIPYLGLLYLFAIQHFADSRFGSSLIVFFAASLFGNTAALMMSTFYGHGMTALFFLATIYFLWQNAIGVAGMMLGFCVLCDYGSSLFIPPFLVWVFFLEKRALPRFLLGAIGPALLWIWYHVSAFGSPFRIANQFQNPIYQDLLQEKNHLWGILLPFPRGTILIELLFGQSRGILWTQPWILIAMVLPLFHKVTKEQKALYFLLLSCTVALLWMNASFGGWHGGLPPGPRYLSAVFPAWAFWVALVYQGLTKPLRSLLAVALSAAILFSAMVYASELSADVVPLWPLYFKRLLIAPTPGIISRVVFLCCVALALVFSTYRCLRSRVVSTL